MNELESSVFPSLHQCKEGWPSDQEDFAKPPLLARPGWFSDWEPKGKPPRPRQLRWLRSISWWRSHPSLRWCKEGN